MALDDFKDAIYYCSLFRAIFQRGELSAGIRAISELFRNVMIDLRDISVACIQSDEIAQAVKSADVTVVNFMGSESGIYLTWKHNATLAYLIGQQESHMNGMLPNTCH